jgi:hypothetical protein
MTPVLGIGHQVQVQHMFFPSMQGEPGVLNRSSPHLTERWETSLGIPWIFWVIPLLLGAHQEDIDQGAFSISGAGSIYIFARSSGSWSQRAKVFAQAYGTQDYFGRAVSIDPCGIVVGAPFSDFTTNDEAGAAFFVDTKPTPLSLSLLSFTGTALPTGNQLDWQTRSESTEGSFWGGAKGTADRRVPCHWAG